MIWRIDHDDEVDGPPAAVAGDHADDHAREDPRDEDHERVDDTLHERQRDHVAVGDVGNFVGEHRLDLVGLHLLQQPDADRDQRVVAFCAGRERVRNR